MLNKKGVASLATFSFIVILLVMIFIFSFNYYKDSKEDFEVLNKEAEVLNSLLSFRSDVLNILVKENSSIIYNNSYDIDEINISVNNKIISGKLFYLGNIVEKNISVLGANFCSSYSFNSLEIISFYYNGSCISVTN